MFGFAGLHTPLREKLADLAWLWTGLIPRRPSHRRPGLLLDQLSAAWAAQAAFPHAKCVVRPDGGQRADSPPE